MFTTILLSVAAVLVVVVLLRAVLERSWVRIVWLGSLLVASLLAVGAGWLDSQVSKIHYGIGTGGSAMCGVTVLVLSIFVIVALPIVALARRDTLVDDEGRNKNKTPF